MTACMCRVDRLWRTKDSKRSGVWPSWAGSLDPATSTPVELSGGWLVVMDPVYSLSLCLLNLFSIHYDENILYIWRITAAPCAIFSLWRIQGALQSKGSQQSNDDLHVPCRSALEDQGLHKFGGLAFLGRISCPCITNDSEIIRWIARSHGSFSF